MRDPVPRDASASKGWQDHLASGYLSPTSTTPQPRRHSLRIQPSPSQSPRPTLLVLFDIKQFRVMVRNVQASGSSRNMIQSTPPTAWSERRWISIPATIVYGNEANGQKVEWLIGLLESPNDFYGDVRKLAEEQLRALCPRPTSIQVVSDFLRTALNYIKEQYWLSGIECDYVFLLPSHWREREISAYSASIVSAGIRSKKFRHEMDARAWYIARNPTFPSRKWSVVILSREEFMLPPANVVQSSQGITRVLVSLLIWRHHSPIKCTAVYSVLGPKLLRQQGNRVFMTLSSLLIWFNNWTGKGSSISQSRVQSPGSMD